MPRRTLRTAMSGALAVLISQAAWLAAPAPASADPVPADPSATAACSDASPMAGNELAATALATSCGHEVEVSTDADEYGGVFAQPDGRMIWRGGVEPYRAKEDDGSWQPIDTTLSMTADGRLTARNTVTPVEFSAGGKTPFAKVTHEGKSFGLTWPGSLPKPTISGNTATYTDVLPGVDLVVRALPEGFSHDLVVRSASAAANPKLEKIRLGVAGSGVKAATGEDGGFIVTDTATGERFAASPPPVMWDSPSAADGLGPRSGPSMMAAGAQPDVDVAQLGVEASGQSIALIPDKALLTGADTQYPVTIDPLWTFGTRNNEWGMVWEKFPSQISWKGGAPTMTDTSNGNAGVGQSCDYYSGLTCTSQKYRMRTFFRLNTEAVSRDPDRDIISARFMLLQRWSANCNNTGRAKLWATSIIESTNTWDKQPTWHEDTTALSTGSANHGNGCPGGPAYVDFDVKKMAQEAKDGLWYSFTVGMRATNESPSPDLNEWRRYDAGSAKLEIEYNTRPKTPTGASTDGKGCATATPGTWVTTMTPTLTASPQDADGGTVSTIFDLYAADGTTLVKEWRVSSAANQTVTTTVPAGTLTTGAYSWTAKTDDGRVVSAASAKCLFQVDTNPPPTPTATLITADPIVGQPVRFRLEGPADTASFNYAVTGGAKTNVIAANGSVEISPVPGKNYLDHVLQVWAKDAAGNESTRFDLPFSTRLPSQIGYWPLAGDGVDKTGAHDLTPPATATWVTDSFGKAAGAMHMENSCAGTSGPVVDTGKSFTVSTWVKPSATTTNNDVLTQRNSQTGGFWVNSQLMTTGKIRWWASMQGIVPVEGVLRNQSEATAAVFDPGTWQHLTLSYDATANAMTLYVNGVSQFVRTDLYPRTAPQDTTPLFVGCYSPTSTTGLLTGDVHDVRVFDSAVTPEQAGAIAAKPISLWALNENGLDTVGGNNLTFNGTPAWDDDRNDYPKFAYALALGGNGYAQSAANGVRTDKSFTVAGWVKLTNKSSNRTLVSQTATNRSSFYIEYLAGTIDRWQFSMPSNDTTSVVWSDARAKDAPEIGAWYHLAGVYDASRGQIRFYVNGELQSTVNAPATPWHVDGKVLVGAAGTNAGVRWNYMVGAVDDIRLYAGVIDDRRLTDISCSYIAICGGA